MDNLERNLISLINLLSNNLSKVSVDQLDDRNKSIQNLENQNIINDNANNSITYLIDMSADLLYYQSMIEIALGLDFTE